ncbi:MAG: hypothetical protein EKK41_23145 [Hyphomicrobiales bacterium]|nr:MAG: hypothetical protein EKK41_23145 [Hyphomicrobiales bacterium]
MAGLYTAGVQTDNLITGSEHIAVDTFLPSGQNPQTAKLSLARLAMAMNYLANNVSTTPVAGTRYYVDTSIGTDGTVVTGIRALIGATGGTDKFIFELHDSAGNLVATTALAGVTVGTANTYQAIPFTAPVTVNAGVYFIVVQNNGTTARIATYNAPVSPLLTGSATGTFGTSAAITPPTTYTAGVGPVAMLY